jgi:hypothetical protein
VAHYKTKRAAKLGEGCEDQFVAQFGCSVERVAHNFVTHVGTVFLPFDARVNLERARAFFSHLDPLIARIVVVQGAQVRVEWEESRIPKTSQNVCVKAARRKK